MIRFNILEQFARNSTRLRDNIGNLFNGNNYGTIVQDIVFNPPLALVWPGMTCPDPPQVSYLSSRC